MPKPFRFAVQVSTATDGKAWRQLARKIESLGYSTLFVPDHFGDQWEPAVAMTVAAEATSTLNVGALVFDNDYRHPVVLAKEIATLDVISQGRVEFGIGAGWMISDYEEAGMPYDPPGTRIDRMAEGLDVMRQLWRDGVANLQGEHYTVTNAQGHPRPHTAGGPKVLIGGGGRKILTIAAQQADIIGVNPNLKSGKVDASVASSALAELYKERLGWIRDAAGERFDDIELQVLTFMIQVTDDPQGVYERMAPLFNLTPEQLAEVPIGLAGTVESMCEQLERRREELGLSYVVVHEQEMDDFAAVVARLAGT